MSITIESTTHADVLDGLRERRASIVREQAALPVIDLSITGSVRREVSPELERALTQVDAELAALDGGPEPETDLEQAHADAEASRQEADEAERARVVAVDRAVQTYDLETIEWHLSRLDPDNVLTGEAWRVWERRRVEVVNQPVDEEANERRHLAGLKARRVELQEAFWVYDKHEAAAQLGELEKEIEECEARLGMVGAPPVPPDPIAVAVGEAQAELAALEARRGGLALRAFEGKPDAAEEFAALDLQAQGLQAKIATAEAARTERDRIRSERAQAVTDAEGKRLAEAADVAAGERDEAFHTLAVAAERLVPVALRAVEAEVAAQTAASHTGQAVARLQHVPVQLILALLQHNGVRVSDGDVLPAAQRARLIETWLTSVPKSDPRCRVCTHENRAQVEAALSSATQTEVAARYGLSRAGLQRHASSHAGATA